MSDENERFETRAIRRHGLTDDRELSQVHGHVGSDTCSLPMAVTRLSTEASLRHDLSSNGMAHWADRRIAALSHSLGTYGLTYRTIIGIHGVSVCAWSYHLLHSDFHLSALLQEILSQA
jgi:hypothetical protein